MSNTTEMSDTNITKDIVSNQDITKNIVSTESNISAEPLIVVPAEHTFAPLNSVALNDTFDQSYDQNHDKPQHTLKNKTEIHMHLGKPNPKEDIKNPFVIALIVLAAVIVILVIVLIAIIMVGKQNTTTTSGTSGGNSGHHKWLALRHHRKNKDPKRDKFEHHPSGQNDPSGWQLYLLEGCSFCTKQMEKLNGFNTFAKYSRGKPDPIINNISGELYPREKMNGFPLWYNSNTKEVKMGFQQDICNLSPKISTANC